MAKKSEVVTSKMVVGSADEAPAAPKAVTGSVTKRVDGMVRLQHMTGGSVSFGKGEGKKAAYCWRGRGIVSVPETVAREILCRFRNRFRALDPV